MSVVGVRVAFQAHVDAEAIGKDHVDHAQVVGHDALDAEFAGRDGAEADIAADFDEVRADVTFSAAERLSGRGW